MYAQQQPQPQPYAHPQEGYIATQVGVVPVAAMMPIAYPPHFLPPFIGFHPENQWTTGLFGCFSDVSSCCEVIWCPYCQLGYQDRKLHTGYGGLNYCTCLYYLFLDSICPIRFGFMYKASRIRDLVQARFNIEPHDWCINQFQGYCCAPCSLCQTYRELSNRGYWPMGVCLSQPPPVTHPMGAPVMLGMGVN